MNQSQFIAAMPFLLIKIGIIAPLLFNFVNGIWVPYIQTSPGAVAANPLQALICSVQINAPWLGTILFYVIYASAMIFLAATEGKFIRFAYGSFAMIFIGIAFVSYGCLNPNIPMMPSYNILAPIAGFALTLIASAIYG